MSENSVNLSSLRYVIVKHLVVKTEGVRQRERLSQHCILHEEQLSVIPMGVATSHQYQTFSQASSTLQSASAL